jgi:hypothetical protein
VLTARSAFIGVLVCGLLAAFPLAASAAITIGQTPSNDPYNFSQCSWGKAPAAATFGQSITVPAGDNVLDQFSFFVVENTNPLNGFPTGPADITYKAYVFEWDGANNKAVGAPLWASALPQTVHATIDIQEVVAATGGLALASGTQYVLMFSVSETSALNNDGDNACFMYPSNFGSYPGGSWEFLSNGEDTTKWTSDPWPQTGDSDVAFSASFSAPSGGEETIYTFDGFYSPINNKDAEGRYILNRVNAGAAIPVKFSLGGDYGLDVFEAGYPKSEVIACDSQAEVDGVEQTVNAGSSSLSYAAGSDTYNYVWKTDQSWADSCRQLVVKFNDGTTARANFTFR